MEVETTVAVDAPPEKVWAVLEDVERWPEWTASMSKVERLDSGAFGVGSRVRIKQPGMPSAVWEVSRFAPGASFAWTSKAPGLNSFGDHRVTPTATGSSATLVFKQSGAFAPLFAFLFERRARRFVETEAAGLKRRAEGAG